MVTYDNPMSVGFGKEEIFLVCAWLINRYGLTFGTDRKVALGTIQRPAPNRSDHAYQFNLPHYRSKSQIYPWGIYFFGGGQTMKPMSLGSIFHNQKAAVF